MARPVSITGDRKLDRAFKAFESKTQKKHLRKGTREAAKVVQADAKALAPVDTGALERSLKVRALPRSRTSQGHGVHTGRSSTIRAAAKAGGLEYYGTFLELGTNKMPADPFLRPALYSNGPQILGAVQSAMRASIREAGR